MRLLLDIVPTSVGTDPVSELVCKYMYVGAAMVPSSVGTGPVSW
eukprot:CAMPEP_0119428014 /NCGR_PEP_ID=MMETSP1335-20130426/39545_1 /TAXON_ID=259385 /ORGANISM="Chrysoculter rhomboideus, Strain RCC1486" /LENGTH=43 /DNA_ID= /DNA_START= /DNA_END= /DNA_ORIENTATION=